MPDLQEDSFQWAHSWLQEITNGGNIANKTKAARPETATKILLYDVETSPNLAYVWGKYEQDVLEFVSHRKIISFAWKWLGEKKTHVLALPDFPGYKRNPENNKPLVSELHKVMSQADIVIGHNVERFDDKRANTDFVLNGFQPPPPHKTIDTLRAARERFDFNSNKLGDLGAILGLGHKVKHHGFALWLGCIRRDRQCWSLMKKYNKGDVVLLEKIYLKLRPWIPRHPNLNAMEGKDNCPNCGGKNLKPEGFRTVNWVKMRRWSCRECGKWSYGKITKKGWRIK